jgi:hypothetical protein
MQPANYDPQETWVGRWEVVDSSIINHPTQELLRHRGQYVAWSMDGQRVLASAAGQEELNAEARRLGLADGNYMVEYVPEIT